ncbi:MAG: hypothetical protein Q9192_000184 [Flavoplaca navasiana]
MPEAFAAVRAPRIVIKYCTQCKWMLRASWYAQELLSTFSTTLGEVALVPATGGVFTIEIVHLSTTLTSNTKIGNLSHNNSEPWSELLTKELWDRKTQGGFPAFLALGLTISDIRLESKELKRLVRDIIEPSRDLGHVDDRHGSSLKPDNRIETVALDRSPHQVMNIDTSSSSATSAFPKRPGNERGQSESLTTAEFAASQVAERMLADITDNFEANTKLDKSSARSGSLKLGLEGSEMEQSAAHSGDSGWNETDATHSAR